MATPSRGEIRRLADAFPAAEAERASKHVEDAIQAQRDTLQTLHGYLTDNQELSKLVQDLPNKVSYNIMVPFGKAAFFPGRLVHTNEFLVLLGEGYYAECSAKETVEILERRGKFLDSKIAGVNSQLGDLHAESLFFKDTLTEAAAGVVEIREDYVESSTTEPSPSLEAGSSKLSELSSEKHVERPVCGIQSISSEQSLTASGDEDKEHERLMARLSELEAAEAAAGLETSDEEDNLGRGSDENWLHSSHASSDLGQPSKHLVQESGVKQERARQQLAQRSKTIDTMQPDGLEASQNQTSDGMPTIRGPGDLLKFEEWRRKMSENECAKPTQEEKGLLVGLEEEATWSSHEQASAPNHSFSLQKQKSTQEEKNLLIGLKEKATRPSHEQASEPNYSSSLQKQNLRKSTGTSRAQKAFTGTVLERTAPSLPADVSQGPKLTQTRPTSKFKMRQSGN